MAAGTISIPVKYYSTDLVNLNGISWTATAGGMYAGLIYTPNSNNVVIGVTIDGFSRIRTTDFIQPYINSDDGKVYLMSNVASFSTGGQGAKMSVRVIYI